MVHQNTTIWIGLDVHAESITAAILRGRQPRVPRGGPFARGHQQVRALFRRLSARGPIRACYEASGAGFVLQRALTADGFRCEVIAPSLIPRRPGERRKTDRLDAMMLARLYRSGHLTAVHVPGEDQQAGPAAPSAPGELPRPADRCPTPDHGHPALPRACLHRNQEYLDRDAPHLALSSASNPHRPPAGDPRGGTGTPRVHGDTGEGPGHRARSTGPFPRYRRGSEALACLRGVKTLTALTLLLEIGDVRRFPSPRQLMAYFGLVPSEHSSGEKEHRGSITKAGNTHARRVLVEAAWNNHHRSGANLILNRRRQGQPPEIVAIAVKAQHRLAKKFFGSTSGSTATWPLPPSPGNSRASCGPSSWPCPLTRRRASANN